MTIREIARHAGVSPATVSRYFTGAERISGDTAEKIRSVVDSCEGVNHARRKNTNDTVAILVPNLKFRYFCDAIREIIDQMPDYPFRTVVIPTSDGQARYKDLLREMKLKGIVFLEEDIDSDILEWVQKANVKTVHCGAASITSRSAMVHINDLAAAYEGTKYLIGLGHKKIAYLSDFQNSISVGFQRMVGAKKAMEEAGLEYDEKLVRYGEVVYDVGYTFATELLDEGRDFTALFAFSDEMAIGAMNAILDYGLKVPEDISVMGFDDLQVANCVRPRLTSIHQPLREIVKNTLDTFLETDSDGNMSIKAVTLPYSIVERDSCRRI
jgi:DNA-binding LacI/PurR family transcriptional regulator